MRFGVVLAGVLVVVLVGASQALAGPFWRLSSRAAPTNLPPGGKGLIVVAADNLGDAGVKGGTTPVTIKETLPEGLVVTGGVAGIRARRFYSVTGEAEEEANWSCSLTGLREVSCTTTLAVPPYEGLEVLIPVEVAEPAGTVTSLSNKLSVEGGEAEEEGGGMVPGASLSRPIEVSEEPVSFGLEEGGYSLIPENDGGSLDSQAGSHPFQLTTTVDFNETLETVPVKEGVVPVKGFQPAAPALANDLSFSLPPGLLGNIKAAEQCSEVDFSSVGEGNINLCPAGSAVGVATVSINITKPYGYANFAVPLFNLVPAPGEPARFGFEINKVPVVLDASVRTGGDYGVTVKVSNASEAGQLLGSQVTFWGVPGDPRHDQSRGWVCLLAGTYVHHEQPCEAPSPRSTTPFLTLPTSCTGPLSTLMEGDSWTGDQLRSGYVPLASSLGGPLERLEGCEQLPFSASIGVEPVQQAEEGRPEERTTTASTPTGLNVDVEVPQQTTLEAGRLGEADVKATTVTLPEGVQLNPSAANGLKACSEEQVGFEGEGGEDPFSPGAPAPLRFSTEAARCPEAAKIGIVHIKTPLLNEELEGGVYLATQEANPFGALVALYIVAENPALGVRVKLAGEAKLNGETGQITATFQNTPQVPFEELRLELFGGPRGSITTPSLCGSYTTTASFTPWSGTAAVNTSSEASKFNIASGPDGSSCAEPQPFAPGFQAGSTSEQAGAFTPFTLTITRPDADQALKSVSVTLPPGAAALLASVTPCPEPQAALGTCGPESLIGEATASSGLGPDPYTVGGGRVYITGPYDGAPFGLSIVTPAVAGPFNLGNVVVRSSINVNPNTAAVTISSVLPTIVQGVGMASSGIPLQLQRINVVVNREHFEFNPTNCTPMKITGTLGGARGASAPVSYPFQVANCSSLPFKPTFTASTQAKTSKAHGASLTVKVTSTPGQANIGKTALILPMALPSRLTTIQKACVDKTFEANPATCPEGSVIGSATVRTPVLKRPLSGPAYLVSHGGAAFPDVEFVLQGEGITLILDGQTDIKKGVTSSTFNSVPDAPVSTFETVLPEGPHSALATDIPAKDNGSLCSTKLVMPTTITGQNGAVITQNTKIAVSGCPKALTRAQELAKALKACRTRYKRSRAKRAACEKRARKSYGAKTAKKKKKKSKKTKKK